MYEKYLVLNEATVRANKQLQLYHQYNSTCTNNLYTINGNKETICQTV